MDKPVVPVVELGSSAGRRKMPVIGLGTASDNFDENAIRHAVLEAIKVGHRHFDTASVYGSERALGEAIGDAIRIGLIGSREELFITSKLWCSDTHPQLVLPALKKSLRNLNMTYVDLYLVHWPISAKSTDQNVNPIPQEDLQPMDFKGVWEAMEECQRLGLTMSIVVSNFSCKKLDLILSFATITPSVNQVEMNPTWQQRKLLEFCKAKGVVITAYSPLGAVNTIWGTNRVMENGLLNQIAEAHGKTVAQVSLRWIYEQGATFVVKSFNKERLKENLGIFDWALTADDHEKINGIPQCRMMTKEDLVSPHGPYKTLEELWDEES